MEVPFYDPLLIIEKTNGRMAGDNQWVQMIRNIVAEGSSMKMIDLSRLEPQEALNHTSKGNQLK